MKIGLLTYYGDLNCGTNLQAFATLSALRKVYSHDIVTIVPFHGFKPEIRPYKSFNPISILHDIVRISKYRDFKRNYLEIVDSDPIIKDVNQALKYIASFNFDKIYIGADTLLELDRINNDGLSAYWLKDIKSEKNLIAASAKNLAYDNLTLRQRDDMNSAIMQFKYIGVRDRATAKLFSHFVSTSDIHYVPDPTFTLDIDYSIINHYLEKKCVQIPSNSVFMHLYGDDEWADELAKHLKLLGYYIITPRPYKYSDMVLNDMGPLEQLGIYKYFDFVITHRFHDCVFSLKNNTPFFVYVKSKKVFMTQDKDSKHVSLLMDFGLYPDSFLGYVDDGISLSDIEEKIKKLKCKFDKEKISKKVEDLNKEYFNYLKSTI